MDARECGSCSLCCKLLGIEALQKPVDRWCGHFKSGVGCAIHPERPGECRDFFCEWVKGGGWSEAWRPDKSHMMLYTQDRGRLLKVAVDPAHPDAWRKEPYYSDLKRASRFTLDGGRIVVTIGVRRIMIFPDKDYDLGDLPLSVKIDSGVQRTPFGIISYARVRRD